jgi:hypothetical protein
VAALHESQQSTVSTLLPLPTTPPPDPVGGPTHRDVEHV